MMRCFDSKGERSVPRLYEDDYCIVYDKPSGLLVFPIDQADHDTLVYMVNQQYRTSPITQIPPLQKNETVSFGLHPCHRLDKEASGAILFAKGKKNQQHFMEEFRQKRIHKIYIAFVHGRLSRPQGEIHLPIKDFYQKKFQRHLPAQAALTRFKLRKASADYTVVEVEPVTGRTNQIRIHFKAIGHPLVGEDKYIFRRDYALKFKRVALHAWKLAWRDPLTKKIISVEAPLARDMQQFLARHH